MPLLLPDRSHCQVHLNLAYINLSLEERQEAGWSVGARAIVAAFDCLPPATGQHVGSVVEPGDDHPVRRRPQ